MKSAACFASWFFFLFPLVIRSTCGYSAAASTAETSAWLCEWMFSRKLTPPEDVKEYLVSDDSRPRLRDSSNSFFNPTRGQMREFSQAPIQTPENVRSSLERTHLLLNNLCFHEQSSDDE